MTWSARVLLADDEETFLLSTADLLREAGLTVDTVSSGEVASERLATERYDLLISDIRMAGNAELQLVRHLHQTPHPPPVILVTGYPSLRTAVPAVHLSVAAYLIKPLTFEELLLHARRAVEQHRVAEALGRVRDRSLEWQRDAARLAAAGQGGLRGPGAAGLEGFINLTLSNILGSLNDLYQVIGTQHQPAGTVQHACKAFNCPRHARLHAVVRDAIETLEATKGAFKSRQLGDLRIRLESALADIGEATG